MRIRQLAILVGLMGAVFTMPSAAFGAAAPVQLGYTGSEQAYTVPSGVMLEGVLVQGGWGGSTDPQPPAVDGIFAAGATLQGYLATSPGETLYAEVGQNGTAGGGATFGGGGAAGSPPPGVPDCTLSGSDMSVPCDGPWAGSGGGASDIRTCSELAASCPGGGTSAESRLIVAAGGGGEGGGGLTGNGAGCGGGTEYDTAGRGQNNQLPTASSAGPMAITTPAGIVIPGFAGGDLASVTTAFGYTNAAMGTTAAGAGGTGTECSVGTSPNTVTFSGSVSGSSGSGADGGAGGSASALSACCGSLTAAPGGGGGGGGGYFGGGGGATGMGSCSGTSCPGNGGSGQGGGAGSSFASNAIQYPTFTFAGNTGDVYVEFWPIIEIDTPANGAVYSPGQVLDAQWECDGYGQGPGGCDNSSGTVPSGSPINTSPGTHTFTVNANVNVTGNGSQPVNASVTYTVAYPPTASITTPANNATYAVGQVVDSSFGCTDGDGGPGISSCIDQNGKASGSSIDTSLPGTYTYQVTATSGDELTGTETVSYTVASPPTASISAPASGGIYAVGEAVPSSFSCQDSSSGTGLSSCIDSQGVSGGTDSLNTLAPGNYTYTVTANSLDGLTGTTSISYTVAGAPTATITAPAGGGGYAENATVPTTFSCLDGAFGPGITSCVDSNGSSTGSGDLPTTTPGANTYSVTATSGDLQSGTSSINYTVWGPPTAMIATPVPGQTYTLNQVVPTSFSCADYTGAPGLAASGGCVDSNGASANSAGVGSGQLVTSTPGTLTYSVTATSQDGLTDTTAIQYTVKNATVGPPTISIVTPTSGAQYTYGSVPTSSFMCSDAVSAPGIKSCKARIDGGGAFSNGTKLVGTVGSHTMTVTAVSKDGQSAMRSVSYIVNKAATTLAAASQASAGKVSATLTIAGGAPLAGKTVTFTVGSTTLCRAATNTNGVAACSFGAVKQKQVNAAGDYTATYAGSANYLGSTASAPSVGAGTVASDLARGRARQGRARGSRRRSVRSTRRYLPRTFGDRLAVEGLR